MNNEQILNDRWSNIDKYLAKYLKDYKNVNANTRDNLQNIFNSLNINYSDANKSISKTERDRLNRFIDKLRKESLISGLYGYKVNQLTKHKEITYLEMLDLMISGIYVEQNKNLDEYNNLLFYNVAKDGYNQGINDIKKNRNIKPVRFSIPILYTLLNIPILNATADSYLYSLALNNADEMYKKTLINMQLGKELNVDNKFYKDLLDKQDNRYINLGDKLSGSIVDITNNLANLAYLQAGKDTNNEQCRFIAVMDNKTTKMCKTLNNQIFYVNKMNVYQRYSAADNRIVTYHTQGLVLGENLPPINNHFHWCRSTISYDIYPGIVDDTRKRLTKNED